ncbi:UDP-4-amino-4,6-dideoxy-N-acetyl-beta-L-altrosamine transaminase [Aquincola tertiaricarbonis]|uniref:UDP-4-amino-4, 6-dideoxy-N-acetyl-beta-L-altrosamine transaminase n=1 Tax=Aquincola tertiaricarbonis TaxID=391953 RepID=A0ABY4S4R1_AQUTE|nr:UDP-4-amino-4,6-dideoxy-N-acetyl-beta-L-altrosamine transaminase [Aquincola tertiaricarbonis]URI06320.1 UDP-4-amino-4,6-dideoxy-N-acetyl-beta-L-altrosamine transaminase [Aquincola tertiaricarbonis]
MIPYGRQQITDEDVAAVVATLRSDFLTQGPQVPAFEAAVAHAVGAAHAVAVNSATSALHIACLALGLGPGDWLWTSPITFVASANCARYCGAAVDFVDIDPQTRNLSVQALQAKLEEAERLGRLPKVLVAVHLCGDPCDMQALHALAQRYGFAVVEDASHAIGAQYRGQPVGNGRWSDITVFSFHPVKIITSAEGGMALTQRADLAERMQLLRSHGITRDAAAMTQSPDGPWAYEQIDLGFNYRMTELQAALGLSQLNRLHHYVQVRQQLAARYDKALAGLPLTLPWRDARDQSALHLYVVRVQPGAPMDRAALFERLRARGIGVNVHYIPVHTQPYYRRLGFAPGDFPQAERYYAEALSLPLFAGLTDEQQATVVAALHEALAA